MFISNFSCYTRKIEFPLPPKIMYLLITNKMPTSVVSGVDWDSKPQYSSVNAPYVLPPYIIVRVTCLNETHPVLMIFKTTFVTRTDHNGPPSLKFWKFEINSHPRLLLSEATWHEDGTDLPAHEYFVERSATEVRPLSFYSCKIRRTRCYAKIRSLGDVYEYEFTKPRNVLPPAYSWIERGNDVDRELHYNPGPRMERILENNLRVFQSTLPPPLPPPQPAVQPVVQSVTVEVKKIPTFVFHAYVTSAIEKNETCPVSLEPLKKETVGCPPCGHLFDKDALKSALEVNGKCPTCRGLAKPSEIQTW